MEWQRKFWLGERWFCQAASGVFWLGRFERRNRNVFWMERRCNKCQQQPCSCGGNDSRGRSLAGGHLQRHFFGVAGRALDLRWRGRTLWWRRRRKQSLLQVQPGGSHEPGLSQCGFWRRALGRKRLLQVRRGGPHEPRVSQRRLWRRPVWWERLLQVW